MIEIKTRIRKWGNSFGVVVPQKAVEQADIVDGDEVTIFINKDKKNILKEMFGTLKIKKSTEQIMKDVDEELYND